VTLVAPYEKETPKVKIRILQDPDSSSANFNLQIEENGIIKKIGYTL
jgi:hypothetical protein